MKDLPIPGGGAAAPAAGERHHGDGRVGGGAAGGHALVAQRGHRPGGAGARLCQLFKGSDWMGLV